MSPAESAEFDRDGFPLDPDSQAAGARKNQLVRPWIWPMFGLIGLMVFDLTSSGLAGPPRETRLLSPDGPSSLSSPDAANWTTCDRL
jgi:hypothetical protein